jgi:hypothetical protein
LFDPGSVVGVITSNYDECGGDITQVGHSPMTAEERLRIPDDHGRSCTIAAFINPPADDQFTCEEANTYAATAVSLDYTNNGTAGCLIQGSVVGVITSNYDECGGDITKCGHSPMTAVEQLPIHRRSR